MMEVLGSQNGNECGFYTNVLKISLSGISHQEYLVS